MTTRTWSVGAMFCALLLVAGRAESEPRFLSKQYTRCSSCHYSATGGGLLTSYGRSLSGQELATTRRVSPQPSAENVVSGEEAFLFGVLGEHLGPLQLGISLRPSHLRYESGTFSDSRNLLMNADIEGAYRAGGWTAYGEAGRMPEIEGKAATFYSREHWISYATARGVEIKVGRYLPAYGVHFADHTSFNRSVLGFDKHDQVYGIEVSRTSDRSLLQVSVSPGSAESIVDDPNETSFNATGRLQVDLSPKVVVVGSGLYRDGSTQQERHGAVGGAIGLALWRRLTIWTEGDAYLRSSGGTSFVVVNEIALEALRGVWIKVSPQGRTGSEQSPGVFRWNVGASLLPRAHFGVSFDLYLDKAEGSERAFKVFLTQLHVYL